MIKQIIKFSEENIHVIIRHRRQRLFCGIDLSNVQYVIG